MIIAVQDKPEICVYTPTYHRALFLYTVSLYHADGVNVSSNRTNSAASLVVEWSSPSHSPTLPGHPCGNKNES